MRQHPITNGVAEGLNSKIMSIKRTAGGFRNPDHVTTASYFHRGGLDPEEAELQSSGPEPLSKTI